ncbi:MAG TPA: class I adenylate-forming enzyme family protein, partial [Thermodesulfobacteriota bacterium]|nr:class I adenylate-forming enzyme family protein [Thermodesulfobacteriota bacterium]
ITGFFGVLSTGAIAVPINTAYKEEEVGFYISHSSAGLTLTEEGLRPLVERASACASQVAVIRGDKTDWRFSNGNIRGNPGIQIEPDDEAIYLYSTGSTGKPKRVSRTHFNLTALADNHTQTVGWTEEDRILLAIPLSHTYAFGNFISAIKVGASIYTMGEFNRNRVIDLIERESITVFPAVPFMLGVLAETFLPKSRDLSSLRLVISAGAPLPRETFYRFHERFGIYPRQLYGSTETGVISINLSDDIVRKSDSVGRPVKNVEVEIFREDGSRAQMGELGEIAVRSPSMTTGYYGLPDETERAFRDGYYFTGDLGRIDEEGYIYILGRKRLFINISGNKVDPQEVENLLLKHQKVKEAVVLGVKDDRGNEIVKAVIVPKERMETREIYEFCKGRISDFKIPRIIEFRDEIPKSPTGKVLREYLM